MLVCNDYNLINRTCAMYGLLGTTLNFRNMDTYGTTLKYLDLVTTRRIALVLHVSSEMTQMYRINCYVHDDDKLLYRTYAMMINVTSVTMLIYSHWRQKTISDRRRQSEFFFLLPFFNVLRRENDQVQDDFKLEALTEISVVQKDSKLSKRTDSHRSLETTRAHFCHCLTTDRFLANAKCLRRGSVTGRSAATAMK